MGSTFRVRFKAQEWLFRKPKPRVERAIEFAKGGTVLLVDDDAMIRRVGRRMLEKAGYEVLTATDGRQGVEVYREHVGEIDCVILDLTMPRMSGDEALVELKKIDPDVRAIISSGYPASRVTKRVAGLSAAGFLHKPYDQAALVRKIAEAVNTN